MQNMMKQAVRLLMAMTVLLLKSSPTLILSLTKRNGAVIAPRNQRHGSQVTTFFDEKIDNEHLKNLMQRTQISLSLHFPVDRGHHYCGSMTERGLHGSGGMAASSCRSRTRWTLSRHSRSRSTPRQSPSCAACCCASRPAPRSSPHAACLPRALTAMHHHCYASSLLCIIRCR